MAGAARRAELKRSPMTLIRTMMQRLAPLMLLVALFGATSRIAAPAGFMPAFGPEGVHFILCSGTAVPAAPISGDHHAPMPGDAGACPFAVAAHAGDAPLVTAPPLPSIAIPPQNQPATTRPTPFRTGIAARAYLATGPPTTV